MAKVSALFSLLLGAAIFVGANGLTATAVALNAATLEFPESLVGIILSSYFVGFVVGTYTGPHIIAATGHIRAFAVFAATACAAVLLHALLSSAFAWVILRFVAGASIVGLFMVVESWINERTSNENRGTFFSIYQGTALLSLGFGQYLLLIDSGSRSTPFIIGGLLFALALLPVCLTRLAEPAPIRPARLNLKYLWEASPLGVLGTAGAAVGNSMLFAIGPVYGRLVGMGPDQVAIFISVMVFGGAVLQWPIGRLSDRVDRRTIILVVAVVASLLAAGQVFVPGDRGTLFYLVSFCYGGAVLSLYPLCVAHAGDHVPAADLVRMASGLLLVFGLGATIGPILGGIVIDWFGAKAFFATLSAVMLLLAATVLARMFVRPPPPFEAQEPFVPLVGTSQASLEMLPDATAEQQHP